MSEEEPAAMMEARSKTWDDVWQREKRCLPDWYSYGSRCFRFFYTPMTWFDAENYCLYFGANLASIHNPGEQEFIWEIVGGNNRAWIGGSDAVKSFKWLWSDGSVFNYQNWAYGEPNDLYGQERCMERMNMWNNQNCEVSLPFICGTRPDGPI
ncbi:hypothetical protein PAMP_008407 [Pampus punctatissimus]